MKEEKNYTKYKRKLLSEITLGDLIRASDMLAALLSLIPGPNEITDDSEDVQREIDKKAMFFQTGNYCRRCGASLYLSDLPQYDEVCYACDENF